MIKSAEGYIVDSSQALGETPLGQNKNQFSKMFKNKKLLRLIAIFILSLSFMIAGFFVIFNNKVQVAGAAKTNEVISVKEPINIVFNKKVKHQAKIEINQSTLYETAWQDNFDSSKLIIKPKDRWEVGKGYVFNISDVKSIFGLEMPQIEVDIKIQTAPKIVSSSPADQSTNVPISTAVKLELDFSNEDLISPVFLVEPAVASKFKLAEDKKSYTVNFDQPLSQSSSYSIKVFDAFRKNGSQYGEQIYQMSFNTVPKLGLAISPSGGGILKNAEVIVKFDSPVDQKSAETAFSVNPINDGAISWIDSSSFKFSPSTPWKLGTTYNVKVAAGVKSNLGGVLEGDGVTSFTTLGYVTASYNISWNASELPVNSSISAYFNQPVDHASAQAKFSISPSVNGSFDWKGNTLIFYPSGQSTLTKYYVNLAPGIKSINGLDSVQDFATTYTTETPVNVLNLYLDKQDYPLSCEFASLKMALNYKGVVVTEDDLIYLVGYDGPAIKVNNVWGNPNRGFVGQLNGNGVTTGYGVYWNPIASAGSRYRSSTAFTGGSAQTLANAIDAGNPIVIWGIVGGGGRIDWTDSSTGETVYAVKGEHARVVKGYKGNASNPIGFYIADPIFGNLYWSTDQLYANWGWFGNAGVVVH